MNDDLAGVVRRYPRRFVGLGTIPAQAPKLAVEELRRLKADLHFPGIQIGSHVNDWNLDAKELYPVWKACEELGEILQVVSSFLNLSDTMMPKITPVIVVLVARKEISTLVFALTI